MTLEDSSTGKPADDKKPRLPQRPRSVRCMLGRSRPTKGKAFESTSQHGNDAIDVDMAGADGM